MSAKPSQGVIARFGKPVRIVNRFKDGEQFGGPGAGLAFRIPFAESIVWIDKRVRDLDMDKQQVLSTDQRRLEVDAFARYRVVDPLRMYLAARTERSGRAGAEADPRLAAQERARQAAVRLACCRRNARARWRISAPASTGSARQYGVEIVDVRIKKADLPERDAA